MHINIGVEHKVNPRQIQHVQDTLALIIICMLQFKF